ncbi:MAG: hypothetical protein COB53_03425 [Elusimicrobia bacterium]|nr:MAG: hypothetical protein COB53_03425 [Elusimicrobiota bacterium]
MKHLLSLSLILALAPAARAGTPDSHLDFTLSAEEIAKNCDAALKDVKSKLDALVASKGARTFQNSIVAFDYVTSDFSDDTVSLYFPNYVGPNKDVREAAHKCEKRVDKFGVDINTREDLYLAMKAVDGSGLTGTDKKLYDRTIQDFKRNGLDLEPVKRARYKILKKQLVEMSSSFSKNIADVNDHVAFTKEEMEGIPEDFLNRLKKTDAGLYIVTLDYPDVYPFLKLAKNPESRRRMSLKFGNRAVPHNVALLEEILAVRLKLAKLLGYDTHAHYVLEQRMAKTPKEVKKFLSKMKKRLKPKGKSDIKRMLALKLKEQPGDPVFRSWDYSYYKNLEIKNRFAVDQEKIKEYFEMGKTSEEMFKIYQELFGLKFKEIVPANAWHEDVKLYSVSDSKSGDLIGHFYLDLYPREGKYKHAAAFGLIGGRENLDGKFRKPVAAMVANFPKPNKDRPSLLPHSGSSSDVETLFHEFGHIMHQMLTKAKYPRFSGTSVARDFVEAPSQMLENWIWKKSILKRLSAHYKTGEALPEATIDSMIAAKNAHTGVSYLGQTFYATIDQIYHDGKPEASTTVAYNKHYEAIRMIPANPGTNAQASFGHLMGYASGYYGYMWSEVFASDMFSAFEKGGIMNPELGRKYRDLVLAPGGSGNEMEYLRAFLGREPNETAFLKDIGLN